MLFSVKGTVTTVGQSLFDNNGEIFAYIEVTESSGRRVMIEKVAIHNDIRMIFQMGLTGEFFVDRIFRSGQVRCQLWGIKTGDREIFDRKNLRLYSGLSHLMYGLVIIPIFGLGLILVIPAALRLCRCIGAPRRRMFYGSGVSRMRAPQQQVMRI